MVFFASAVLFALAAGVFDRKKRRRKRKNLGTKNGAPPKKRLKHSDSTSSSSEDDDDSLDSDSSFDIFSSESISDTDVSSLAENLHSDFEDNISDSDNSVLQDDISIKDEPIYDSDLELSTDGDKDQRDKSHIRSKTQYSTETMPVTIKTEVLDSIVDAVEVDRSTLLSNPEVQIKEEPVESTNATESAVEVKEEPVLND